MQEEKLQTGSDDVSSAPDASDPGTENAPATPELPVVHATQSLPEQLAEVSEIPEDIHVQPKLTRLYRGRKCEIIKTTKNSLTGAIHDLVLSPRTVTDRKNGSSQVVFLGIKLRRPGTGDTPPPVEIEIETEIES